jgi:hypothetical protein
MRRDEQEATAFEQLLIKHRVLIFRGQELTETEELAVMKRLPHTTLDSGRLR